MFSVPAMNLKKKFCRTPHEKMRIAVEAASAHANLRKLAVESGVSRPTLYQWRGKLLSKHSVQAIFGDTKGRGTFSKVLAERDRLRQRLKSGTRTRTDGIQERYGRKRCGVCGQWLPRCGVIGARGGTRTRTPFRESDFKSLASTIPPPGR